MPCEGRWRLPLLGSRVRACLCHPFRETRAIEIDIDKELPVHVGHEDTTKAPLMTPWCAG